MDSVVLTLRFLCSSEFWRMALFWTLSLLTSYFRLSRGDSESHPRSNKSHFFPTPSSSAHIPRFTSHLFTPDYYYSAQNRPVCIITGASSGLGAAAANALSLEGFFVVLVGRSKFRLAMAMMDIASQNVDAQLEAFEVDLSSFQSILKFKSSLEQFLLDRDMHPSVQLLINNAGILAKEYRSTEDGLDEMMASNYAGAFCLTSLLLPLLRSSHVPARIVNVTSFTHRNVSDMQVDKEFVAGTSFSKLASYPFAHVYEYSKVCLLSFTYELHRQFSLSEEACQVSVVAADPGAVKTKIMREIPSCLSHLAFLVLKLVGLLRSPEDGVHSILDAALAPPEVSGVYFFGGKGRTVRSSPLSYDSKLADRLWKASTDLFLELKLASK